MDGIKPSVDRTETVAAFLAALTEASAKHGIAITGKPMLFVMEQQDYQFAYRADAESNLHFG